MIVFLANNIGGYDYRPDVYNPVDKYINHLKVALLSLNTHCDYFVKVYLIDCVPEVGYDLQKLYKNILVEHIKPTAPDNERNYSSNPKRFIMMREKILAIKSALSVHPWVLFIDCDVIIRNRLEEIVHNMVSNKSRLDIRYRQEAEQNKHKFNTGVIGLNSTTRTRELVHNWYAESLKSQELSCEQEGLYNAYCKMRDKIKLVPLQNRYNCWNWGEEPIIYHCKGKYFNYLPFASRYYSLLWEAQQIIMGK